MKNLIILLVPVLFFTASCKNTPQQSSDTKKEITETVSLEIKIEGMTCNGCEQTIENAVKSLAGVMSVDASHVNANAIIEVDPAKLDTTLIKTKIDETGYKTLAFITPEKE